MHRDCDEIRSTYRLAADGAWGMAHGAEVIIDALTTELMSAWGEDRILKDLEADDAGAALLAALLIAARASHAGGSVGRPATSLGAAAYRLADARKVILSL